MKMEDYNEYYIQGSDHYLIPKDEFEELFNEMINWKEENQKQKEVIDKIEKYCYKFGECTPRLSEVIDILNEGKNEL